MATMYSVMGGTLLNLGITLGSQGNQAVASGSFVGAGELFFDGVSSNLKFKIYRQLFGEMQEFSWRSFFGVCKGLKSLKNLRKWSEFWPSKYHNTFSCIFNTHSFETLLHNVFNKHIRYRILFLYLFVRAKAYLEGRNTRASPRQFESENCIQEENKNWLLDWEEAADIDLL